MIDLISDAIGSPKLSDMLGNKEQFEKAQAIRKEQEQVDFIEANINWLRDYHSKFAKTDDPDEFDNWMGETDNERLIEIINETKK